jgi:hypothetical protein
MRILSTLFLWIPGLKYKQPESKDPGYYEKP